MSKHMLAALSKFSYLNEFETNRVIDARSTQQNQQKKTPQKIIAFVYQCLKSCPFFILLYVFVTIPAHFINPGSSNKIRAIQISSPKSRTFAYNGFCPIVVIVCPVLLPERSTGTMDMNRSYTFGAPYGDSPEYPDGRLSAWTALMCYILSQFSFCINVFLK